MGFVMNLLTAPRALRTLREARALLDTVTPLRSDCGKLCENACCRADTTGENGMLLYPFEEKLYREPIDGFPFRLAPDDSLTKGGWRLICEGRCPRAYRPLACRVFPLRIRVAADEQAARTDVTAELDPRAWAVCPLPEAGGLRAVRQDFIGAVEQAGTMMIRNVCLLEALLNEQRLIETLRSF